MRDLLKCDVFPGVCEESFTWKIIAYFVFCISDGQYGIN